MRNIEILAPAGSYESMVGAFNAGADAVYMGGPKFGARAYADNPDVQGLLSAIDYAHIHGKKLYLTVNTLFKDSELEEELYPYLAPLYAQGLDAVIVQDMGALTAIRSWFPDMDLHASTQMTVTSHSQAKRLIELGVTRIVPARELSIDEVRRLKIAFGGEIECFVHGALCYCYSGQCLFSSMLGGRSGNRGRCAQPCRLPYTYSESAKGTEGYMLSPKDICTLENIPDLVDAGIDSYKIEGRMKKPEYAAFVSYVYRKYTDLYLEKGRNGFRVEPDDLQALADLYNRGGFSGGYYNQHNGPKMMSFKRPNHFGSYVGKVSKVSGKSISFMPEAALGKGDVLLIDGMEDKDSITVKEDIAARQRCTLTAVSGVKAGSFVYRLRNEKLLQNIKERFLDVKKQQNIYFNVKLYKDFPVTMQVTYPQADIEVIVYGAVCEKAAKRPLTEDVIREKLTKTGNTPFCVADIDISMDEDAYLPLTALNELRRAGVEALTKAVLDGYRREAKAEPESEIFKTDGIDIHGTEAAKNADTIVNAKNAGTTINDKKNALDVPVRTALTGTVSVARLLADSGLFSEIYLESWLLDEPELEDAVTCLKKAGTKVLLAFPHIFRDDSRQAWMAKTDRIKKLGFDGFLIRNMESYDFIRDFGLMSESSRIVSDYNVYAMNRRSADWLLSLEISRTTLPVELNYKELLNRGCSGEELVVYGYLPLMVSAQCLHKNTGKCDKKSGYGHLTDRYKKTFVTKNVCSECYNLIYNSQPLVLYDQESKIRRLSPAAIRWQFTFESPKEVEQMLKNLNENHFDAFTRGHFNRGVE